MTLKSKGEPVTIVILSPEETCLIIFSSTNWLLPLTSFFLSPNNACWKCLTKPIFFDISDNILFRQLDQLRNGSCYDTRYVLLLNRNIIDCIKKRDLLVRTSINIDSSIEGVHVVVWERLGSEGLNLTWWLLFSITILYTSCWNILNHIHISSDEV